MLLRDSAKQTGRVEVSFHRRVSKKSKARPLDDECRSAWCPSGQRRVCFVGRAAAAVTATAAFDGGGERRRARSRIRIRQRRDCVRRLGIGVDERCGPVARQRGGRDVDPRERSTRLVHAVRAGTVRLRLAGCGRGRPGTAAAAAAPAADAPRRRNRQARAQSTRASLVATSCIANADSGGSSGDARADCECERQWQWRRCSGGVVHSGRCIRRSSRPDHLAAARISAPLSNTSVHRCRGGFHGRTPRRITALASGRRRRRDTAVPGAAPSSNAVSAAQLSSALDIQSARGGSLARQGHRGQSDRAESQHCGPRQPLSCARAAPVVDLSASGRSAASCGGPHCAL